MFFWNSPAFSMIQQMLAIWFLVIPPLRLPLWLSGKESAWNAGNARNIGSFPGSGRPPAEGHVNPLLYSCLENPMDRETWRAIVHKIAKSWTWLKWLNKQHTHTHTYSAFSKPSLHVWKFLVHVLLKPSLKNFEHYLASIWNEHNCMLVWTFFGIALLWDWNENWPFPGLWPLLRFPNLLTYWVQHFHSIIFQDLE